MVKATCKFDQIASTFGMVQIAKLHVDPEAQRVLAPYWVKTRIPLFDVEQLGCIVVNRRANGNLYIVDGQHRVELLRAVGWGDQEVHAEVFSNLDQAGEAELFLARNDRKAVRLIDKFRVSITAGNREAIDINKIVLAHGLMISDQAKDGHVVAVNALERVYRGAGIASPKAGPAALSNALRTCVQAWGKQASSLNGQVVQGLGLVFLRYNSKVDQPSLIKKLSPLSGGAPGLLGRGRAIQELRGRPIHHCIASIVVDVYNKGRHANKLEAWES